jgi:hypothetical protein
MTANGNLTGFLIGAALAFASCATPGAPTLAAQADAGYTLLAELPGPFKAFATDKLRQVYGVTEQNELIKYDAGGKEVFRYNNNYLGELERVDATNPFNLLLFYPDYQTAITLDRTLSQTGQINLISLGYTQVPAIGLSNDNNIWLYDDFNFQLKKIDAMGEVLAGSDDLSLLLGGPLAPVQITARENSVYMSDPARGVLVFDNFGQYTKTIQVEGVRRFQVLTERLLFEQEGALFSFHLQSLQTTRLSIPEGTETGDRLQIQKDRLYALKTNGKLMIYRF